MKFTIRDIMLLTVIVALTLGWFLDHYRQVMNANSVLELQRDANDSFQMLRNYMANEGYEVNYDSENKMLITVSPAKKAIPISSASSQNPPKKQSP